MAKRTLLRLSALLHKTSAVERFKCFYCDQSEAITASHKGPARVAEGAFRHPGQRAPLDQ